MKFPISAGLFELNDRLTQQSTRLLVEAGDAAREFVQDAEASGLSREECAQLLREVLVPTAIITAEVRPSLLRRDVTG